jgi:hypothetical protein
MHVLLIAMIIHEEEKDMYVVARNALSPNLNEQLMRTSVCLEK